MASMWANDLLLERKSPLSYRRCFVRQFIKGYFYQLRIRQSGSISEFQEHKQKKGLMIK